MFVLFALACSSSTPVPEPPAEPSAEVAPEDGTLIIQKGQPDGSVAAPTTPSAPAAPVNVTRSPDVPAGQELLAWIAGKKFHSPLVFLEFTEVGRVQMTWNHMEGDAVQGKLRLHENGIEIHWDTEAKNTLNRVYRMVPTSACEMSLVYQKRKVGPEVTEPVAFVRQDPGCQKKSE